MSGASCQRARGILASAARRWVPAGRLCSCSDTSECFAPGVTSVLKLWLVPSGTSLFLHQPAPCCVLERRQKLVSWVCLQRLKKGTRERCRNKVKGRC